MTNDELDAPVLLDVLMKDKDTLRSVLAKWKAARDTERDRATRAEALAERLAGALPDPHKLETLAMLAMWFDRTDASRGHTGTGVQDDLRAWAAAIRQALSAYRGVRDEACSRPSDALDAPVQPTSSQPERTAP